VDNTNNNNNNIADSNQSDVNTDSVNTYNSIQPSSPLVNNINGNGTESDDSVVENLSGIEPVVTSSTSAEELLSQEPVSQTAQNNIQDVSAVGGTGFDANVVEDLSGVQPTTLSGTSAEELPSQEPVSQTIQSDVQNISTEPQMPSFGSIPVMGESVASSFVSEQQSVQSTDTIDMSAPLSQPISSNLEILNNKEEQSVPSFEPAVQQPQAELSANSSTQTPMETPSIPAFNESEIINTLGNEKSEKKGGNAVVIILIIVIVALLLAIGYFAYKVFFV